MSILTELLHGKITWDEAKTKAEGWAANVKQADPALGAAADQAVSAVKQGASNAISWADTAMAAHLGVVTDSVEAGLEGALSAATHGASIPFNPMIDATIDQLADAAKKAADAWALALKARLASPQAAQP